MSRVGERVLTIPKGTTVTVDGVKVEVKGEKGTLTKEFSPLIAVKIDESKVVVSRANEEKHTKQLHGTTNALISSMIEGVSKGFKKEIAIKGVGYKAAIKGDKIEVNAGYSHLVVLDIIPGVKVEAPKPIEIIITGVDKQAVGQMAALIRNVRKPSPYSGKGIMYKGEYIRRKEGKAAAK